MAARDDKTQDPVLRQQLLLTRRGQSYFSRKLHELSDAEFDEPSGLAGWTRRHLIAHVGLNARALTNLTEWAATGVETPMYSSPTQRNDDIEFSSTLPVQALRNLSDHAAIHLNVEWRDLEADAWMHEVRTAQGRTVPVSETIWMRAREVWIHAVDLDNGGSFADFPAEFVDRLLTDVLGAWDKRRDAEALPSFVLSPTDRASSVSSGDVASAVTLYGTATDLAAWATGRGTDGVSASTGEVPVAPRWL
ncbi:maleylpyruvate isomerase [Okibacterium sp. HSC-33S16]|uniref:maleylpyruvate isomerase family mycothiol-dependent enzyme n=1 Tax=Okibacterium sp. HSC-33S16 TaxID=2910965 RepID=UPI00209CC724|nr:maleylpyruvate isomerase family mycothiol-dependent enzyme [Okibacterium sp. HSC-33S16]MCP2032495.1 maleylpyruvate isomerase [Okibacterium sp. HSC-33S16]